LIFNIERVGLILFNLEKLVREGRMRKHLFAVIVVTLLAIMTLPFMAASGDKESEGTSISDFKAHPLHRAVELKWTVKAPFKKGVTFQILRSDSFVEGPYEEIATIPYVKEDIEYTYFDKKMRSESKYYYKLVVLGGRETYGPIAARPFFSLPST
jgi:hypothetical protein